ncbi:hypothetical protein O181_107379 [Austropuccinia psidii MF-1]|uniref:Uncharacterized protein n=1 Tax=Austropuccinia psidii MF-1 TaxID=1389203 RepID=A0A9Q3PMZ0_9BASI|nr:hypothetical protein [Austropuccinia psidii MF-1]
MIETWGSCFFEDLDYFNVSERDTNYRRILVALSFIFMSIDRTLFQSTTSQIYMPNAQSTYQALKKRFSKALSSAIVQHASRSFVPSDQLTNNRGKGVATNLIVPQIGHPRINHQQRPPNEIFPDEDGDEDDEDKEGEYDEVCLHIGFCLCKY